MKYFKISEFACPCCGKTAMQDNFLKKIDEARELAGVPFLISSGYRCEKYNELLKERGYRVAKYSSHMTGYAADILVDKNNKQKIIEACEKVFKRMGIAEKFIHVDCDPSKPSPVRWKY